MVDEQQLTGSSARRERGRREMREAILDAAGRIVAAEGVDGLTLRGVAQALSYSPAALYEYFDSKEAILAALYFGGAEGLGTRCERAVADLPEDATSIDALLALGRAYRSYALDHAELYRLVFGGFKTPPQPPAMECPDENRGGFGTLLRVATQGVADGTFVDLPPLVITCAVWSAVHGYVSLEVSGHVTGGEMPGMPPSSPDEGQRCRDQLFSAVGRMVLFGFASDTYRSQARGL